MSTGFGGETIGLVLQQDPLAGTPIHHDNVAKQWLSHKEHPESWGGVG